MLIRAILALLLLFPAAASAQELDTAFSALVRISGTRDGTTVRGTGFVVGLDHDKATIVTASHVIEGMEMARVQVAFAGDPKSFPADVILGMDFNNPNGLAVFLVRGTLPSGTTVLSLDSERPHIGEALFLLGFPNMELSPRTTQRVLSARRGTSLLIDQEIGEGFSGGPVLKDGKVVGVVIGMDGQTTYAVNAVVVREALEGWGVKFGRQISVSTNTLKTTPPTPVVENCVPGEERTEAGIVYVHICPGTFTMGSAKNDPRASANEKPAHQVTLSEFWIGKTEITREQYRRFRSDQQGFNQSPATFVSWDNAKAACEYFGGRLPTEAEWEYAARAGSQTFWSFGDDETMFGEYGWHFKNSHYVTNPVGIKKPNAWGLYDVHGNVWEWVFDRYGPYTKGPQKDPTGPKAGKTRVIRGGAFNGWPGFIHSAVRLESYPGDQNSYVGFRCAYSPRILP
ncbi:MAG TPA: SUMF1/EgtB/PvdO family nonheme iron enzyme [Thermoanaerobaculia bacterium]|nr:SUMF1/EgtB/PvdO family nonheme iron enzyme [Thermoanaerobaculia bacterium]